MTEETNMPTRRSLLIAGAYVLAGAPAALAQVTRAVDTFEQNEIARAAGDLFGGVNAALAELIEKAFKEQGRPNAYITGREASGAIGVGLRYGDGNLVLKRGGRRRVYWQGPSIGFDFGGNASKSFTLVYGIRRANEIFQRFPGVDGSIYFVGGFGMNYQRSGNITLAPIRSGVGLRAGVSVGYLHYSETGSWLPF